MSFVTERVKLPGYKDVENLSKQKKSHCLSFLPHVILIVRLPSHVIRDYVRCEKILELASVFWLPAHLQNKLMLYLDTKPNKSWIHVKVENWRFFKSYICDTR